MSPIAYCCPTHGSPLHAAAEALDCPHGCSFPVRGGIPRFVDSRHYADNFGLQWNVFRRTQLDSFTGTTISRDRLVRMFGGDLERVAGKTVLEAGCGAGRFSEVLLRHGAEVYAVDLSTAVEANAENCRSFAAHHVCQADVTALPFAPGRFDIVAAVGMVQHTPDPEATIAALCRQVKPGGMVVLDHYTHGYAMTPVRTRLRRELLQMPPTAALNFCEILLDTLWPVHEMLWKNRGRPEFAALRGPFLEGSPLVDYQPYYPQLGPEILRSWALLDTHDTLTDVYKHLRSAEEIRACLESCGMTEVSAVYAGNGVEARAVRPAPVEGR